MDEVNQEIHFPISHFLYHCFYKNGNLIKYMLLPLSLRFCSIIDNGSAGNGLPLSCVVINLFYIHHLSAISNSPIVWVQMSMYGIVLTILMFSISSLPPKAKSREYPKHSS